VIHATGADSDPRVLAIRAVELVRATMLEPPPSAPAAPTAPEGSVRAAPPPPPPPPQKRAWSVGVGAAWLESTGGLGRALGVAARAERLRGDGLGLSLLIAAAPFASRLHTDLGTVTMDQELAELGLIVRARRGARLQPHVVVGAGGYHLRARGVPAPGAGGSSSGDGVWAVLACAGGGAALAVATGVGLFVDLQSILTYPFPAIPRDGGFARAGNPSLLASLGAQLAF
jgi:hypothetical protein